MNNTNKNIFLFSGSLFSSKIGYTIYKGVNIVF